MDKKQRQTFEQLGYGLEELGIKDGIQTTPKITLYKDGEAHPNMPADSYHLNRYLKRGFTPTPPEDSKPQSDKIKCDICGDDFKHRGALTGHMRSHTTN